MAKKTFEDIFGKRGSVKAFDLTKPPTNQDKHYKDMQIEPLEVMRSILTPDEYRGFLKGNIIKYGMRQGRKEGQSAELDAKKARSYAELLKSFNEADL